LQLHYLKNPRYDKEAINHTRVLTRPLETEADLQEFAYTGRPKFKFPDGDHNYMVAQPDVVEFLDYAVDKTYEKVLYIRNATAVSRSITILPPATSFFSFTNIEFPSKSKSQLAPGMAAKITVRFCPDSLADYDDYCSVLSEGGKFKVKVRSELLDAVQFNTLTLPTRRFALCLAPRPTHRSSGRTGRPRCSRSLRPSTLGLALSETPSA